MKPLFRYAASQMAKLTGKSVVPRSILVMAHQPRLFNGAAAMETALAGLTSLPPRPKLLAELQVARLVHCRYCIDIGAAIAARAGIADDEMLTLPDFHRHPGFGAMDRAVLEFATAMSQTPCAVTATHRRNLAAFFTNPQIVELAAVIAWENHRARFNHAAGLDPEGFHSTASAGTTPQTPRDDRVSATRLAHRR